MGRGDGRGVNGGFFSGFSLVVTRPAGKVRRFPKSRGASRVGGSGQEVFEISSVG